MTDGNSKRVAKPRRSSPRWTSFVATKGRGRVARTLEEESNPKHSLRVEHNRDTLLIQLSGEHGAGWTTIAIDRATREWAIAQRKGQIASAQATSEILYG
jgi:hypothetical protein